MCDLIFKCACCSLYSRVVKFGLSVGLYCQHSNIMLVISLGQSSGGSILYPSLTYCDEWLGYS